jgi:glycosyltransferase involved in cell wall biosynthesis
MAAKLLELVDDPGRCARMGESGRRRVENELEWRYEVPKLLAAYEAAFVRRPAGSPFPQHTSPGSPPTQL